MRKIKTQQCFPQFFPHRTMVQWNTFLVKSIHSCSVTKSCLTLCDPMGCSTLGFPGLHYLPEFAQIHVHWVNDPIQPSRSLSPPSPPALNLSQVQRLFQWVGSLNQVVKGLELQLQHQSFQWKEHRVRETHCS